MNDPIIAEVRAAREKLAARFKFDVKAICDNARKNQKSQGIKLFRSWINGLPLKRFDGWAVEPKELHTPTIAQRVSPPTSRRLNAYGLKTGDNSGDNEIYNYEISWI